MSKLLLIFVALIVIIPTTFFTFRLLTNTQRDTVSPPNQPTPNLSTVPSDLSADENFVLDNVSKIDLRGREAKQFSESLNRTAISSGQINITNCSPTPTVFKIESNKTFTIRNNDSSEHNLVIYQKSYTIPAQNSIDIQADFGETNRVYPYSCDEDPVVGVIWVVS